jgi:hypothetical protein
MAVAVMTPFRAPPVPVTACTPLPRTAALMPAERSPFEIIDPGAGRADIRDETVLTGSVEDHDDQVLDPLRLRHFAMVFRLSSTGASRSTFPFEEGPTTVLSM